jgi:hypothetical protein
VAQKTRSDNDPSVSRLGLLCGLTLDFLNFTVIKKSGETVERATIKEPSGSNFGFVEPGPQGLTVSQLNPNYVTIWLEPIMTVR